MRDLKLAAFILFLAVLQSVVLSRVPLLGAYIDLPIAMTALLAFTGGPRDGFWYGAFAGLLSDALSPERFVFAVSAALSCFLLGLLRDLLFSDEEPVMFLFVFMGTIFTYLMSSWMLSGIYGRPLSSVWQIVLCVSLLNTLFTPYLKALSRKAESAEDGQRLKI